MREKEIKEAEVRPSLNYLKKSIWKIPTAQRLFPVEGSKFFVKIGIIIDPISQACCFQGESINHIVFACSKARQVWVLANAPHLGTVLMKYLITLIYFLLVMMDSEWITKTIRLVILWIVGACGRIKMASSLKVKLLFSRIWWQMSKRKQNSGCWLSSMRKM